MEKSSVYFDIIFRKPARCYPGACTLEELASLVMPPCNVLRTFSKNIAVQRESQAKILEALIALEDQGCIVLDPDTDEGRITLKGLIEINNAAYCN